jgi:glucose-6-phosphate 1-dehydrogenase
VIDRLVIFGALGDLMRRYLAPALLELETVGRVPAELVVTGVAFDDLGDDGFRERIDDALGRHAPDADPGARDRLLGRLRYVPGDATDSQDVARATEPDRGPLAAYLALPPAVFGAAAAALAEAGFPEGSQLVVEKPFGHDLDSARALNEELHRRTGESSIYRIDHFLGMQTVQNVLGLRFGNRLLEPLWNCHHVERVEIVWDETLTLEGRGFYDEVGAVRDMVQNHLLQLLCLVGMEPPASLDPRELRDRKVQLLREVRRPGRDEIAERSVRARYTAGTIDGRQVRGYAHEDAVDPDRETETFAELELRIDNWRWSGVPVLLRTGKALGRDRKEVVVNFRPVPHGTFSAAPDLPNLLRIQLEPETLALAVNINAPGERLEVDRIELDQELATGDVSAYGRVLLAVLLGDHTLSIRDDEVEQSWAIVDPVLHAWEEGAAPLQEYPAGSPGPGPSLLSPR